MFSSLFTACCECTVPATSTISSTYSDVAWDQMSRVLGGVEHPKTLLVGFIPVQCDLKCYELHYTLFKLVRCSCIYLDVARDQVSGVSGRLEQHKTVKNITYSVLIVFDAVLQACFQLVPKGACVQLNVAWDQSFRVLRCLEQLNTLPVWWLPVFLKKIVSHKNPQGQIKKWKGKVLVFNHIQIYAPYVHAIYWWTQDGLDSQWWLIP